MEDSLASLFADQQTNMIDWDGPVYSLYELSTDETELIIRFVSAKSHPPQGLRIKIRGGALEIDGTIADDVILWQDTAPTKVHALIKWKSKGARSLRIWNAWRVKDVTQAWLGNAGMRVSSIGESLILRCSDGEGDPDFDDLVVEVGLK